MKTNQGRKLRDVLEQAIEQAPPDVRAELNEALLLFKSNAAGATKRAAAAVLEARGGYRGARREGKGS